MKKLFFETIKIVDGVAQNLEYHQKRVDWTLWDNFEGASLDLAQYINFDSDGLYKCKIVYSDKFESVIFEPYTKKEIITIKLIESDIDYRYKYLERESLNRLKPEGYDEIIIIKNGFLSDTSIANIVLKIDEIWYTPKTPLLRGTTREKYLLENKIIPKDLTIQDLNRATQIGFLNAMIDFVIYDKTKLSIN